MMNSLYGKFAQKNQGYKKLGDAFPWEVDYKEGHRFETGEPFTEITFGGATFVSTEKEIGNDSFPGISAFVTSYARLHLWKFITTAREENVYYMDTDSITISDEGKNNLPDSVVSKDLGDIKLEKRGKSLEIFGLKDYKFDNKRTTKGISGNAKEWKEGVFIQDQWDGLKTHIRKGEINTYHHRRIKKVLKREYYKGWIIPGGRVLPLECTIKNGTTCVVPWGDTSYKIRGQRLFLEHQVNWIAKEFKIKTDGEA
jgi:hypothetical protein